MNPRFNTTSSLPFTGSRIGVNPRFNTASSLPFKGSRIPPTSRAGSPGPARTRKCLLGPDRLRRVISLAHFGQVLEAGFTHLPGQPHTPLRRQFRLAVLPDTRLEGIGQGRNRGVRGEGQLFYGIVWKSRDFYVKLQM